MPENDGKYYINIFEDLMNGSKRHLLSIGLGRNANNIYIFDPCLNRGVHFSFHANGDVGIRNGNKKEKIKIFKKGWMDDFNSLKLKQFIYFRPAAGNYLIYNILPNTPLTINHCYNFYDEIVGRRIEIDNIVFKILLGSAQAVSHHIQHLDSEGDIDTFKNDKWVVGISPMALLPQEKHDDGTFVWFFNAKSEIPDKELFSLEKPFEIGPLDLRNQFIVHRRLFGEDEVVSVYFRL